MQKPSLPPRTDDLYAKLLDTGPVSGDLLSRLIHEHNDPAPGGRYRHWHKLRHLRPPEGLTHEVWWLAIKLARSTILKPWPLHGTDGTPFYFAMPDVLQEMVHRIDRRASGTIEAAGPWLADPASKQRYLLGALKEEAIHSSQIEGAATTRRVAKRMLNEGHSPTDMSEQMVLNNYRGMTFIAEAAKERELTADLVFELHGILTEGTLDDPSAVGRFRRDDEQIAVINDAGEVLHDPPREAELPGRLEAMCAFANDDGSQPFIHPVVRSVLLHFWLAHDHPFVDGNGRTARALFYWSMARRGYWLIEYTSLSRLLLRARGRYNRAFLYAESDDNDATYFVLHQCRTILQAIDELHEYIGRKMADTRRSRDILIGGGATSAPLNQRQLALLRNALDHPGATYTIRIHKDYHSVSYQTARTDLLQLAEAGLLDRTKVGREFVFIAPADLDGRLGGVGGE